jgi:hypothetical protein
VASIGRHCRLARAARARAQLFLGGGQQLLDLGGRQRARLARAVLEEQRRRALDTVLAAELDVALERRGVALADRLLRRRAIEHPVAPGLGRVLGTPDVARLDGGIGPRIGYRKV